MNITKQKQTHRYREHTGGHEQREESGEVKGGVLRGTNYYVEISNKDILYNTVKYS